MPDRSPTQLDPWRTAAGLLILLLLAALAGWLPQPWRMPLLLAAQTAAMAAAVHATGAPRRARRAWAGRLALQLALYALFASWLWLLLSWPAGSLVMAPSLGTSLVLALAACIALASLWVLWPLAALPLLETAAGTRSGTVGAWTRRASMLAHAVADRPHAFMLPVALAQVSVTAGALSLGGLLPRPPRAEALAVGLWAVLAAAGALLTAWRCKRASDALAAPAQPAATPAVMSQADASSLSLDTEDTLPGRREAALIEAARQGDTERALALLAAEADPEARPPADDHDRRSVLVLATLLPDTRLLRALIARGARVQGDGSGLAPLLIAVRDAHRNRSNAVMTLLANGADARVCDAEGNTALHFAALGDAPDIAAMLIDAGAEIDALNHGGYTPLALACRSGSRAMVEFLLDHRARTEVDRGVPALVAAADGNDDDVGLVTLLLKRRARPDATDVLGRSALGHAALAGHAGMAAALIEAGAEVDRVDERGTSALMEAARSGSDAVIEVLAAHAPRTDLRDRHGRDALMLACQSPHAGPDTVRALLELGADPRAPGPDGRTALDHAAGAGRWNLVAQLDPDTPLPASHCDDLTPEPGADSPRHLLDALRFGHWAAVSGFRQLLPQWPEHERIELYLQLLGPEHAAARRWLFEHGLDPAARSADGETLAAAVLPALPDAVIALDELLGMGQGLAGRGLLARALGHIGSAPEAAALAPKLIEHDADLFGADANGMTPLHQAAAHAMTRMLELLLARGCDPNVRDREGQTPLHHALKHPPERALPLLRALIAHGADPEAADASGETPLGQALESGEPGSVHWLRWQPWTLPGRALAPGDLTQAAATGDAAAVRRLLELGFDVDTRDSQGATALLRACGNGHIEVARALLEAGANVQLHTPGGATPLTAAVTGRHAAVVSLLLEQPTVNINQRLRGGATALLVSAALGHADIAELLLEHGADVRAADDGGRTALHAAAQFCFGSGDSLASRRILDSLLAHGADATRTDLQGASALLFMLGAHARPGSRCDATHLGALLPVLLEAGARADCADQRGVTPLHACAMHALTGPARLLLARGADRQARDNRERTAADVARLLGFVDVAHELGGRQGVSG